VAEWVYTSSDPLTNSRWSKLMLSQYLVSTLFFRFASPDDTSLIMILDDLQKHAGDNVRYGVSQLLSGAGVMDLNTLTGNEESPVTYGDALYIHELAHAILLVGPISDQRILFDRRKTGRNRLADWYAARTDHSASNQLAGFTPQTDVRFTGMQAPIAASRQLFAQPASPAAPITDAANLTDTNTFNITLIDQAELLAKSLTNGIRPLKVGGRSFYVLFLHSSQATDLRINTSVGQWLDLQKAAMTGGDVGDNPIWWESLGMYRRTLIHENSRVPNSVSNAGAAVANTKRAMFCGAQAAVVAFGRSQQADSKFLWLEELRDFGRQIGVGVSAIWGCKKVVFNNADFGVSVIDTWGQDIDQLGSQEAMAQ
jgi:N4-gp56 family major capsid protein